MKRTSLISTPVPTEQSEAERLMYLVRLHEPQHPELRWLFHVPNGGARSKAAAGKLKAAGVRPGVPDYLLPVAGRGVNKWRGLAIELKRIKGGRTSDEQTDWLDHFDNQYWRIAICNGHEHAWRVICEYLGIANCLETECLVRRK